MSDVAVERMTLEGFLVWNDGTKPDSTIPLGSVDIEIAMSELYERLNFPGDPKTEAGH
jgi:hypothetical protein